MRILLAEENKKTSKAIIKVLRKNAYAVDAVTNGNDALYRAEINTYDLVIMNLIASEKDSSAVCEQFRAEGKTFPILILTGHNEIEDKIRLLDLGADDYLTKPFDQRELLARVRALLRRPNKEMFLTITSVGKLIIDTRSQSVSTDVGTVISLTTREYALLEYFARNANRVIGREEISEHVWNENFDPFSNLIEVYINRLRQKLNANVDNPSLKTRRGTGYILEVLP